MYVCTLRVIQKLRVLLLLLWMWACLAPAEVPHFPCHHIDGRGQFPQYHIVIANRNFNSVCEP